MARSAGDNGVFSTGLEGGPAGPHGLTLERQEWWNENCDKWQRFKPEREREKKV